MNQPELEALIEDLESDRVERKESLSDKEKVAQAICALANDLPDRRQPGVIFIGVKDDGSSSGIPITDQLLLELGAIRSDGNVLPLPEMTVEKRILKGKEVAVVIVQPAFAPPVRYKGRVWIRVGPRRATASVDEERRLTEKKRAWDLPFDGRPFPSSSLTDLDLDWFRNDYLSESIAEDVLEANGRTVEEQLASLRFTFESVPTTIGLLLACKEPIRFIPGAYIQFLRLDGSSLADPIIDEKRLSGPLVQLLAQTEEFLNLNIRTAVDLVSSPTELRQPDYPLVALQQLVRNAVLHRNYENTASPVRISWFANCVEIQSPGGPYGQVTVENFGQPGLTDYRNPFLAEAMKSLGYVQRFGVGLATARRELERNGNPPLELEINATTVLARLRSRS